MHKNIKCVVITPESYHVQKNKRFPVLYLLHGYGGNYASWVRDAASTPALADEGGFIVVCPDGAIGSWYFDSKIDTAYMYETHISKEVLPYIDGHFRTIADRKARAIAGLSMGGHGALYLAIRHKELFSAAISLSGGVDFTPFPDKWDIAKRLGSYENNRESWAQHTVQYQAQLLHNHDLEIVIDCGTEDFFIGVNRSLHQKLQELKIAHDYIERPGAHNWQYWDNAIVYHFFYLKKLFEKQLN